MLAALRSSCTVKNRIIKVDYFTGHGQILNFVYVLHTFSLQIKNIICKCILFYSIDSFIWSIFNKSIVDLYSLYTVQEEEDTVLIYPVNMFQDNVKLPKS